MHVFSHWAALMVWTIWHDCSCLTAQLFSVFFFFFSFFKLVAITTNRPWLKWHRLKTFIRLGSAPSSAAKDFVQLYSHVQCYCSTPANRFWCEKSVDSPLINKSNGYIKVTATEKKSTSVKGISGHQNSFPTPGCCVSSVHCGCGLYMKRGYSDVMHKEQICVPSCVSYKSNAQLPGGETLYTASLPLHL